jgi:MerR family copper efflux transcriptional regulator
VTAAAATMTVGELARRTGVSIKALRDYTDWGLIDTLGRSPSNYRLYTPESLWCVRTITEMRRLGLTLSEIRCAAQVASRDRDAVGPRLAEMLRDARARIERRIAELEETRARLDEFVAAHHAELLGEVPLWPEAPGESAA